MQIHEIKVAKRPDRKTIGRGGKRGTYSGRGNKGQKARSGGNVDPLFEGGRSSLVERLKKLRGFKSPHAKKIVLTLGMIERRFVAGETVDQETLLKKKIIGKMEKAVEVKILATGKLSKKISVAKGIALSAGARAAIEKAGGKILE